MITFRLATESDIPLLRRLADEIWRACYREMISPAQLDYMLAWMYGEAKLREELRAGLRWELIEADGQPVGYLACEWEPGTRRLKLHKLYLQPGLHGHGIGQRGLQRANEIAAELGARQIYLTVNKGNTRAQQAYQRAGYRVAESIVMDIGGGYVMDDFVMVRDLEPGAAA